MRRFVLASLLVGLTSLAQAGSFRLSVHADDGHGRIRTHFVYNAAPCHGDDVAPSMVWQGAPAATRGYAITVYDPDAVGGWWHWIVLDIPAATQRLNEGGVLPPGAISLANSFGHLHWDGPCPPAGDAPHHYVFTVYALDTSALGLPADASQAAAKAAIHRHTLDSASVTYTYGR